MLTWLLEADVHADSAVTLIRDVISRCKFCPQTLLELQLMCFLSYFTSIAVSYIYLPRDDMTTAFEGNR